MSDTDDFDDSQKFNKKRGWLSINQEIIKKFISLKFSCYVDEKELILSVS